MLRVLKTAEKILTEDGNNNNRGNNEGLPFAMACHFCVCSWLEDVGV